MIFHLKDKNILLIQKNRLKKEKLNGLAKGDKLS